MRLFRRIDPSLGLGRGERVLAQATTTDGERVVATDRALILPGGVRLSWSEVDRASWQPPWLRVGARGGEHRLRLDRPGRLPEAVQERVTSTIVVNQHVRLVGRRGVRVVGRRAPGAQEVDWQLVFDTGLDADDPSLRAQAERVLHDIRRRTGV